jgi:hypothetical protein
MRTGYEIEAADLWTTHMWRTAGVQIRRVQWSLPAVSTVATPKGLLANGREPEKGSDVDKQRKSKSRADLRLCAATIGTSAVLAMAAVGLMLAHEQDGYAVATPPSTSVGTPPLAWPNPQ